MATKSRSGLVDLHLKLIKLEIEAERQRQDELKKQGVSALEVEVDEVEEGNYVYQLVVGCKPLMHGIEKGSVVSVSETRPSSDDAVSEEDKKAKRKPPSAVVTEVLNPSKTILKLRLVFASKPTVWEDTNMLHKTVFVQQAEAICNDQLSKAMKWLKKVDTTGAHSKEKHTVHVVQEMFKENRRKGHFSEYDTSYESETSYSLFNSGLDKSQDKAVKMALGNQPLTVIHGPPGTGKTTTIVEAILQHVKRGQRVLVCAPSNKAVDNMLSTLWNQTKKYPHCSLSMDKVIRVGHPARVDENHRQFSPEAQMKKLRRKERLAWNSQFSQKNDDQQMEMVMRDALVVMSTLTSAPSKADLCGTFDLLVIDECGQATEAACWLAIPFAKKVVLSGDPCQLPPTILSQEAASSGLAVSLMERQMKLHGEDVVHMLDTQHRMHETIQEWSSQNLYEGKLKAAPTVAHHLLPDLSGVSSTPRSQPTLLLMDTAGCRMKESQNNGKSYQNKGEARLIVEHVKFLVGAGMNAEKIGVITPYKGQVSLITRMLRSSKLDKVEVNSVDGYQGAEKEAILLSMVRSNVHRKVGFVGDLRRLNVAVTRARRQLFVVCDTATVCRDRCIRSLVLHLAKSGTRLSAFESRRRPRKDNSSSDDDSDGGGNRAARSTGGAARPTGGEARDDITNLTTRLGAMRLRGDWGTSGKVGKSTSQKHVPVFHQNRTFRPITKATPVTTGAHSMSSRVRQGHARVHARNVKAPLHHQSSRLRSRSDEFSGMHDRDWFD